MRAIDRLKRDHQILHSKLNVLESALHLGQDAWFVLREVCFTLSRQLRDHMRREEDLVMACRQAMNPKVLAEVALEHHDEPELWRSLTRMFADAQTHDVEGIRPALQQAIQGLRHHMTEEERELFPLIERSMTAHPEAPRPSPAGPLHETMTVNHVLHEYPATAPVFRQLWVSAPVEGCSCLDEVAWRHGMKSEDLLQALHDAIAACSCPAETAQTVETATC